MIPNFKRITEIGYAIRGKSITGGRNFHISVILNKSKILSIGINNYTKSHPKNREFGYSPMCKIHAEMAACLKLGMINCSGLTIVNLRINRNGHVDNSLYCHGCSNLIRSLCFKEAFYTDKNGNFVNYE